MSDQSCSPTLWHTNVAPSTVSRTSTGHLIRSVLGLYMAKLLSTSLYDKARGEGNCATTDRHFDESL